MLGPFMLWGAADSSLRARAKKQFGRLRSPQLPGIYVIAASATRGRLRGMVQEHRDAITAAPREWARPASMAFIVGCPMASISSSGTLGAAGWSHDRQRGGRVPALTSRAWIGSRRWMKLVDAHARVRR